jgi:hypothetical protein
MAAGSAAVASTARRLRSPSDLGSRLKPFVFLDLKPTSSAIEGEPPRGDAAAAGRRDDPAARVSGSLLPRRVDTQLRSLERSGTSDRDATTALRETVAAIWTVVAQASSARALDGSRRHTSALLARRELLQRGTCALSAVIRRGVASGAFRPRCASWAIHRLPFAIVAGACLHWMLGLATGPAIRSRTAVETALEVLRPRHRARPSRRSNDLLPIAADLHAAVHILEGEP